MKFTTPYDSVQFTMALTLDSTGVSTLVMVQLGFEKKHPGGFGASTGERGATPLSSFKLVKNLQPATHLTRLLICLSFPFFFRAAGAE